MTMGSSVQWYSKKTDSLNHVLYLTITYRCLYSRNIENLFMAGRNISVTHVALGTVRVMRTTAMLGEVVGMAASVCHKNESLPRSVYTKHLEQLKTMMGKGAKKTDITDNQNFNKEWIIRRTKKVIRSEKEKT